MYVYGSEGPPQAGGSRRAEVTQDSLQGGSDDSVGDPAVFGIVTVSDRASAGIYNDDSGPAILGFFAEAIKSR
jgi:hypothetical protein